MRTREDAISIGKQLDDLNDAIRRKERGAKSAHAKLVMKCGITGSCAFLRFPGYDPYDRAFIDYMHLLKNVVYQHLVKRMLGLCSPPPLPRNEMKTWDDAKRLSVTPRVLAARDAKNLERQALVGTLQAKRLQIIANGALWEMSTTFKVAASERMKKLVCPISYYSHTKNLFEFTGSWDTILWQHFVERFFF
jgi:hypothetical protein